MTLLARSMLARSMPLAVAGVLLASAPALADSDDCRSPVAEWQSRDAATAEVGRLGLGADRIKVDDGCYEVRGRDGDGNRVELKLEPATLAVVELKVKFRPGADPSRYLPGARGLETGSSKAN